MKEINKGIGMRFFKCACKREWAFWEGRDTKGEDLPLGYRTIHKCNSVEIYGKDKSLSRHFIKK